MRYKRPKLRRRLTEGRLLSVKESARLAMMSKIDRERAVAALVKRLYG
jgi:hypothetical protein